MKDFSENIYISTGGHRRLVVGVTGAIASGKSLVSRFFAELGCDVIDADRAGHAVLASGKVTGDLIKTFGSGILAADGQIDRASLARVAFADERAVKKLNSIMHPAMKASFIEQINSLNSKSNKNLIILDAAILFETDWWLLCDTTILVDCPEDLRVNRVIKNRGWDAGELARREKFQFSLDIRRQKADNTLVNSSSEALLRERVRLLHQKLIHTR